MVEGKGDGRIHARVTAGSFLIESGVDQASGGNNEAPSPHDLVEASLAACTILTLELYAKRKEWKLGTVTCSVKITSETSAGTEFVRTISFSESLTPEMRDRLEVIANKCPIHKLLSGSVTIKTSLLG